MKKFIINIYLIITLAFSVSNLYSQSILRGYKYHIAVINGDTIQAITTPEIRVFGYAKGKNAKRRAARRQTKYYARLVNAIKVTYPVAKQAGRKLRVMEAHLNTLKTKQEQTEYIKKVEEELKVQYSPFIRSISMYQGMVLLKLIDRETGKTSFRLIQELRGKFSAFFWQNITRLFGGNLKVEYDKYDEDAMIEEIISLYEIGAI